jgi:tripartite-type tricarboxylate transporter receptor subunit TctC
MATWNEVMPKVAQDLEWQRLLAQGGSLPAIRSARETSLFVGEQFAIYAALAKKFGTVAP